MKTLSAVILIGMLAVVQAAQRAENNTDEQLKARNAPDLFVSSASAYGPDKKGDSNFTIEVQNTGSKTMTAFEWEYNSPDRIPPRKDSNIVRFRNETKLVAGEKKKFTNPVRYYSNEFVTRYRLTTIRIMKVEYEDGSVWERPPSDK